MGSCSWDVNDMDERIDGILHSEREHTEEEHCTVVMICLLVATM